MSYTALYRKYRPITFDDVKGQEHITTTLTNQIKAERIGHAYLFCGTRGTGKTTVAKIFAKAVNCSNPVDGSPCGECELCRKIQAQASLNVIEIDAASNNGVDNIRQIREEVSYRPTEGRYKVYIIDEVHMLSTGAFNALLKTLEEPPEYVIFILATTEVHKIPITILSRCQRYDFRRITVDTIAARIMELLATENVEFEDAAVRYIAKAGDGSMRDALSLLDQCIAFYIGEPLTYEHVLEVLGAVDTDVFSDFLRKILSGNVAAVLEKTEELVMQGRDLGQMSADFTWYLRNLLLMQASDELEDVLDVSKENLAQLKEEATMIETDVLLRYIRIFSELSNQMRYSTQKRILLEVTLIKLCKPEMERNDDSLSDRIRVLERKVEEQGSRVVTQVVNVSAGESLPAVKAKPVLEKALSEDIKLVTKEFRKITGDAGGMLRNYLKQARLSAGNDGQLILVLPDELSAQVVGTPEHIAELKELIEKKIEKSIDIVVRCVQAGASFDESYVDIEKLICMDITIED